MRTISLWQPWATAIALSAKTIETRGWPSRYRGPLAIHAAKRCIRSEMDAFVDQVEFQWALQSVWKSGERWWSDLPFGCVVAICVLADCEPTELFASGQIDVDRGGWCERDMGNFGPGRWGWVLRGIQPLKRPLPFHGSQGFFDVPDRLIEEACA